VSTDKRIDKLEASLSPDQILLRWLDETLKFYSHSEYAQWLAGDPRGRAPSSIFVRDLMPHATAGSREKAAERQKGLMSAVEYLCFGHFLFQGVNKTVERHWPFIGIELEREVARLLHDLLRPVAYLPLPMREEMAALARTALDNYIMMGFYSRWIVPQVTELISSGYRNRVWS